MYENYRDVVDAPQQIVPIDMLDLWKRYTINIRTGCVYDTTTGEYVLPYHGEDKELYIDLESEENGNVTCQLSTLLCTMLYGKTNSGAMDPCTEFPCNTGSIAPEILDYHKCEDALQINDLTYRRWRNTPYFVNQYGSVFSIKMGQWLRINYNDRFYCVVALKNIDPGTPRTQRIHRIVWEAFNGLIPDNLEIDHVDGRRYHNYLDNLQLLSHAENLNKRDPDKYAYVNREDLRAMCELFKQGVPVRKIAKMYNLTEIYTWKIKTGRMFADITESFGYHPEIDGKARRQFTSEQIREIRRRYAAGEKLGTLAAEFKTNKSNIIDISKRRSYVDVA